MYVTECQLIICHHLWLLRVFVRVIRVQVQIFYDSMNQWDVDNQAYLEHSMYHLTVANLY